MQRRFFVRFSGEAMCRAATLDETLDALESAREELVKRGIYLNVGTIKEDRPARSKDETYSVKE